MVSSLRFASSIFQRSGAFDPVSWYGSRLAAVKRALPPRGLVGYLGEEKSAVVHVNGQYYLSQYALAPVVLVFNSAAPDLVLGNFHDPRAQARSFAELGLESKTDFGNGVKLLVHRKR
jgi:hypothetical protein